mmetsp:Transcript_84667/g.224854  ORF Transcript_84667/g.224854 Transcript_84667/m.224854 type:complete len:250 (+) Transcript_84667:875-1624(+)
MLNGLPEAGAHHILDLGIALRLSFSGSCLSFPPLALCNRITHQPLGCQHLRLVLQCDNALVHLVPLLAVLLPRQLREPLLKLGELLGSLGDDLPGLLQLLLLKRSRGAAACLRLFLHLLRFKYLHQDLLLPLKTPRPPRLLRVVQGGLLQRRWPWTGLPCNPVIAGWQQLNWHEGVVRGRRLLHHGARLEPCTCNFNTIALCNLVCGNGEVAPWATELASMPFRHGLLAADLAHLGALLLELLGAPVGA